MPHHCYRLALTSTREIEAQRIDIDAGRKAGRVGVGDLDRYLAVCAGSTMVTVASTGAALSLLSSGAPAKGAA